MAVTPRTGTEHYSFELIAALGRIDAHNRYTLYVNQRPSSLPSLNQRMELRSIPFPRLWTHVRLSAEVVRRRPEVLFIPAHVVPLGAAVVPRLRTVVTIHDLGYLHFPQAHTRAQQLHLRLSTAWSTRVADRVIAISRATRDDLVRLARVPPAKIHVVHHGLAQRFTPGDSHRQVTTLAQYRIRTPYFLYVGTIQPRKNLVRLIEAFAQTVQQGGGLTGVSLVIAGKRGWRSAPIERRAAELGLADRVQFVGYVADEDLSDLMSGALAFVFPSLYEGFGMPVLEAMACGTPVLTSRTSSLPEVAGDAALLVDPSRIDEIASGLRRLASDSSLRSDLREHGLRRAAQFTWERCASETLAVLTGG
jgi:glycosyltransferase involved in cell wall biosynthesis